jgi:hypothetical protein
MVKFVNLRPIDILILKWYNTIILKDQEKLAF